jgi:putative ABC transport system permease protein
LRLWRRHPAFAAAALSTQAIGIAVTTAVLAVAYAVLLRPLPYADPERLMHLFEGTGRSGQFSFPDFLDLRGANRVFEGVAGHSGGSRTLTMAGSVPERLPMAEVTDGFFEVLGVTPRLGRTFNASDVQRGSAPVVILSYRTWTRRFGSDPSTLGKSIMLNGTPHEIVGVLPQAFAFPPRGESEFWLPLRPSLQQEQRGYMHWMRAIARARVGLSDARIRADLDSIAQVIATRDQRDHSNLTLRAMPLRELMVEPVKPAINALLAGVVLVALVTCATTAALLLSRAAPRRRELSVRVALGASRGRIVAQLLTENVLLSLTGGALGIVIGHWLVRLFVAAMPAQQKAGLPHFDNLGVGVVVAAAAMIASVATGLMFGAAPAWRASRLDDRDTLKSVRSTAAAGELRLRSALVALQVAVAVILLSGAGLLATSVRRLLDVPLGFDPASVVTMRLNLPPKYGTGNAVRAFQRRLLDELNASPGIVSTAMINQGPLTGRGNTGDLYVSGRPLPPGTRPPVVTIRTISPGYFSTMRVPLVRGRWFGSTDTAGSPQVAVINRLLADTAFAGDDPIGARVSFQFLPGEWQIVGIVENERFDDVDRPLLPVLYFAAEQNSTGSFTIAVRSSDTGLALSTAARIVNRLDADLPVFGVKTLEALVAESSAVFLRRATLWMLGIFATASALLAALGLYGVLAQSVADRTREIGVRVALGATRAGIVGLVMRRALAAAGTGAALGVIGTLATSRWLSSLLFGVSPRDPLTIAAATVLLGVVALAACVIPTRRALNIDPASAVRD